MTILGGYLTQKNTLGFRLSVKRSAIFSLLQQLTKDNEEYFTTNVSTHSELFKEYFRQIDLFIPTLQSYVIELQRIAPKYDYDLNTPGNGFRSLVCICDIAMLHLVSILRTCIEYRSFTMFRASYYCKEIESYCGILRFFVVLFDKVLSLSRQLPNGSLLPRLDEDCSKFQELFDEIEAADFSFFYGRRLGFQFSPSISRIFRFIGILLATYSLSREKGHGPIGSLINSSRFFLSPEQRASRILKVTREADIEFCKGFWNLSEVGIQVPKFFCPNMAISEVRDIDCTGTIMMETVDGSFVEIPEPSSYTGRRPVRVRVLSYSHRKEMSQSYISPQNYLGHCSPPSPYLLLHCHGGGYVATTSKSHEIYLRTWAKHLDCSVLSIDYSLAPENPFPRAIEEVLYAYAYIVNNSSQMGWTGEKICMVGDSAGGNLIMALNLRLIQLNIKRLPDGLISIYTPFIFQYFPSPSRLLSFMDPLLHAGIVIRCVAAYTSGESTDDGVDNATNKEKPHKSLQDYVKEVKKIRKEDDFNLDNSSIMSLINLTPINEQSINNVKTTIAKEENDDSRLREELSDDEDDLEHETSISSVQVKADSSQIHLFSNSYDRRLIDYLKQHSLTKNSLVLVGQGEKKIDSVDETSQQRSEDSAKPFIRRSPMFSVSFRPLLSNSTTSSPTHPLQPAVSTSRSNNNIKDSISDTPVIKRTLSQSLADTAVLAAGHAFDNISDWIAKSTFSGSTDRVKLDRAASLNPVKSRKVEFDEIAHGEKNSCIKNLLRAKIPRNPLISPLYATADELSRLPPIWFVACHMDPLLDDTITFARRVRDCGGKVMAVDLLDNLPHGFLNFTLISPECREGAKICLNHIREAFGMIS